MKGKSPQEPLWTFSCYQDHRGRNEIHLWLKEIHRDARKALAQLRVALQHLRARPITSWERPHASAVKGHNHIFVIRFRGPNRQQYRLFGHHHQQTFVITAFGVEKDGKYDPPDYGDIATRRKDECDKDPKRHICVGLDPAPDAQWRWELLDKNGHFTPRRIK